MTPAARWDVLVDGVRHRVAYAPGIDTDRPDTLVVDRYPMAIRWRQEPQLDEPGMRLRDRYRATFGIGLQTAAVEWIEVDHAPERQPDRFDLGTRLLGLALSWLPTTPVSGGAESTPGEVRLIVNGQVIPKQ
jgi:hypothetical protein